MRTISARTISKSRRARASRSVERDVRGQGVAELLLEQAAAEPALAVGAGLDLVGEEPAERVEGLARGGRGPFEGVAELLASGGVDVAPGLLEHLVDQLAHPVELRERRLRVEQRDRPAVRSNDGGAAGGLTE